MRQPSDASCWSSNSCGADSMIYCAGSSIGESAPNFSFVLRRFVSARARHAGPFHTASRLSPARWPASAVGCKFRSARCRRSRWCVMGCSWRATRPERVVPASNAYRVMWKSSRTMVRPWGPRTNVNSPSSAVANRRAIISPRLSVTSRYTLLGRPGLCSMICRTATIRPIRACPA